MDKNAFIAVHMAVSHATRARRAALHTLVSEANRSGLYPVAGVDEVGAGALAGPVVAAAVLLKPPAQQLILPPPLEVDDSKKLSRKKREQVFDALYQLSSSHNDKHDDEDDDNAENKDTNIMGTIEISVALISASEVDEINILQARLKAMRQAVEQLKQMPRVLFVDGDRGLHLGTNGNECEQRVIVGGDQKVSLIAAASIIAKVTRDRLMMGPIHEEFPSYGFDRHVGYGTRAHLLALEEHGPCSIHRRSYKPVAKYLRIE